MSYSQAVDVAARRREQSEKCAFCRRTIPNIVEQLKAVREPEPADVLDAIQDIADRLSVIHRAHTKRRAAGLGVKRRPSKPPRKSGGRRPPRR